MQFKPKTKPRSYQAQALKRAFECDGRYGLFLEPRTGKSKVAIDFAAALWTMKRAKKILIVCQLTGHKVWEDQLREHCSVPYQLIVLPRGSRAKAERLRRVRPSSTRLTFVLINYESTWRVEGEIVRWKPDCLIYDEGHKLKNRNAKQSKCAHRLVQALDPYRMLLTGTPIANSPLDVFSEYMVIDDSVFGRRWSPFYNKYAIPGGYMGFRLTYKNVGDLRRRARTRATVLTKEECLDLPQRSYEPVLIDLSPKTMKAYKEMAEEYITFNENGESSSAAIVLTQYLRLQQITSGFATADASSSEKSSEGGNRQPKYLAIGDEKLKEVEHQLDELMDAGEKVVIFCRFRHEIDRVIELCEKRKWKAYRYWGPKNEAERKAQDKYPHEFKRHDGPAVFVAQTATGSLSIDLGCASYVIFYSFDYSLINWEQCHDRVLLQKRPITYLYLLARGTIDQTIWKQMHEKKRVSALLQNDPRAVAFGAEVDS